MPFTRTDDGATSSISSTGNTPADVFIDAAHGLFDVLADGSKIRGDSRQEIVIQAEDQQALFGAWLTELFSRVTLTGMLYSDFEVFSIQKAGAKQYVLTGAIYGEAIDAKRHTIVSGTLDEKSVHCTSTGGAETCTFRMTHSKP